MLSARGFVGEQVASAKAHRHRHSNMRRAKRAIRPTPPIYFATQKKKKISRAAKKNMYFATRYARLIFPVDGIEMQTVGTSMRGV